MKHLLLLFILGLPMATIAQTWTTGVDMPEPVRAGNTAGYSVGDGYLFVVSGRNFNGLITKKNQRYNIGSDTWTELAEHPTGKLGSATTVLKDSLYTIGGLATTPGTANRRVYRYSINQDTWAQVAQMPYPLTDAKAVTYQDSLIYVVGGYSGNTLLYNANTNQWRQATQILPGGSLSWGGFAIKNDTLVYACGTDSFLSNNYFNTVMIGVIDQNDRANITWSESTPFPGNTRTFFDMYEWKDGVILTGGSTDNSFETHSNECYHYNTGTGAWTQLPDKPTSWNTGNSASVLIDGQWQLACSAGYADGYLSQTEIFSEDALGTEAISGNQCGINHFKILHHSGWTIAYCSPKDSAVTITIHDAHGRVVKDWIENGKSGQHQVIVKDLAVSAGIYFCTLKQEQATATQKMIVR